MHPHFLSYHHMDTKCTPFNDVIRLEVVSESGGPLLGSLNCYLKFFFFFFDIKATLNLTLFQTSINHSELQTTMYKKKVSHQIDIPVGYCSLCQCILVVCIKIEWSRRNVRGTDERLFVSLNSCCFLPLTAQQWLNDQILYTFHL